MLIEEEIKSTGEINPDALEAVFEETLVEVEEDILVINNDGDDEQSDSLDLAFKEDEGYW